jgi:hypothetical protein
MRPPHMYFIWRDHVGIEPTGDGTRLPKGFEVLVRKSLENQNAKSLVKSTFLDSNPRGFITKSHADSYVTNKVYFIEG